MLIYLKDVERLIVAVEGAGDNLTEADQASGYRDYVMTSIYKQNGDELELEDGGQMLLNAEYAEYETDELVAKLMDFWGYDIEEVEHVALSV